MHRTPVLSSNVDSVGYDATIKTLEIEFKDESIYQQQEIPEVIFDGM